MKRIWVERKIKRGREEVCRLTPWSVAKHTNPKGSSNRERRETRQFYYGEGKKR